MSKYCDEGTVLQAKRFFAEADEYLLKHPLMFSELPQNIPFDEYLEICERSSHNSWSNEVMLGKFDGGSAGNYINQAKNSGRAHFDLGDDWKVIIHN